MLNSSSCVRVLAYALLSLALLHTACAQFTGAPGPYDVFAYDSKIFVNGVEFIVVGVDYSPTPLGSSANPGTGLCSNRYTPYGQFQNNCYDSDFFDGVPWYGLDQTVNGFQQVWQRDFANIQATGANTIRLYNANPTTFAATSTYTNLFSYNTGRDHNLFMQMCVQYGFKVIFPLILDNTLFAQDSEPVMHRFHRWQIDEVGNYSSLLIWQLGNEQQWTWNQQSWQNTAIMLKYNDYVDYIKRYTWSKWGRRIPVSLSVQNGYAEYDWLMEYTHLDIFGSNVFESGFNGNNQQTFDNTNTITRIGQGTNNYHGMDAATCLYAKPYLITEFGFTFSNGDASQYPQGEINRYWSHIMSNLDSAGITGGVYFEFTDEPTNGGKDQGVYSVSKGTQGTKSSTGVNQLIPDKVTARNPQLSDLISGSYQGKATNFKTNPFTLLGRQPVTYSSSLGDRCTTLGYTQCPGNTIPVCNGNGVCNRNQGSAVCTCGTGWTGPSCATPVCPSAGNGAPQCGGRGSCSTLVSPPECFCNPGYFGSYCQSTPQAGSCPGSVSGAGASGACTNGNGVCNNQTWTCTCFPGWTGLDCAITDLHGLGSTTTSVLATSTASTSATFGITTSTASTSGTFSASVTVAASSSASTSGVAATSTGSLSASTTVAASSTASVSATTSQLVASSTGSVSATTTQSASTSATLAASSSGSVAATSTGSVSTAATFSASTTKVAASTIGVTTSSSASVGVTSTASTSGTVAASSSASTSGTVSKATTTAQTTSTASASTSNQLATSSATVGGTTVTASLFSASTVAVTSTSTTLAGSSTTSVNAAVSTASSSSTAAVSTSTAQASTSSVSSTADAASTTGAVTSSTSQAASIASTSSTGAVTTSSTSSADAASTSSTSSGEAASTSSTSSTVATSIATTSSSQVASVASTTSSSNAVATKLTASTSSSSTSVATHATTTTGIVVTSSSSSGRVNTTSGTISLGSTGSSTTSALKLWDVTITMVVPGNYLCLNLDDLSIVLHQIFKIFPSSEVVIPNVNNQTWFSVNATFIVANSSVFANATKTLMTSPIIQNLIPNCGPNILSASVATSVYVPPNFLQGAATSVAVPNLIFVAFFAVVSLWLPIECL